MGITRRCRPASAATRSRAARATSSCSRATLCFLVSRAVPHAKRGIGAIPCPVNGAHSRSGGSQPIAAGAFVVDALEGVVEIQGRFRAAEEEVTVGAEHVADLAQDGLL